MKNNKMIIIIVFAVVFVLLITLGVVLFVMKNSDVETNRVGDNRIVNNSAVPSIDAQVKKVNGKVVILINATVEDEEGIKSITLPNGEEVEGNTTEYEVKKNGEYNFTVTANNGNEISNKVIVDYFEKSTAENPYIPEGFTHTEGEADTGFIISDSIGNQFVWVPVPTGILTRHTMLDGNFEESGDKSAELTNSVAQYYGFYIGRYEASAYEKNGKKIAASMAGKEPWTNIPYIDAFQSSISMAKSLDYNEEIKTSIVSSSAWDTALEWMNKTENNYSSKTEYGNYSGHKAPTGETKTDIVNNICDMAGNVREWTSEIDKSKSDSSNKKDKKEEVITKRVVRGGSAILSRTANSHIGYQEDLKDEYWGFRMVLYK